MTNSTDPSVHRQREEQFVEHVDKLLDDERLRIDTTTGRRPIPTLGRRIVKEDRETELIRLMAEMDKPDRELQARMPVGLRLTVTLWKPKLFVMKENVGQLKVVCVSPTRDLLGGQTPRPLSAADTTRLSAAIVNEDPSRSSGPLTLVLLSTSGFSMEAHEVADRRADRTLILVEPNDAGGWTVTGPNETQSLVELFDPEGVEDKRQRIRRQIEASKSDLLSGSIAADRIAGATRLPIDLVEAELRAYANQSPGLLAKRLDGRMMVFREGSGISAGAAANGGSDMPFLQRLKNLFSRKEDPETRIAILSERRAVLTQQRDTAYEELGMLERKETDLRQQFKESGSELAKRRLAGQITQLRKDLTRRQQLVQMVEQQINIISTDLHNIELVKQGKAASLPSSDELATHAAAAEEVTAELQADAELAGSLESSAAAGMSDDVRAVYDELEQESKAEQPEIIEPVEPVAPEPVKREKAPVVERPIPEPPMREQPKAETPAAPKRTSEPEAG